MDWSDIVWELASETGYWRNNWGKNKSDGTTRTNMQAATG